MKRKKIMSVLLSATMCLSMVMTPVGVFADETSATSESEETQTTEATDKKEPKETEKPVVKETEKPDSDEKKPETTEKNESSETEKQEPEVTEKETETTTQAPEETEKSEPVESEESKPSETEKSEPEATESQESVPTEEAVSEETSKKKAVNANIESGKCGENLTWTYDYDNSTLTISGSGAMYDYDPYESSFPNAKEIAPWHKNALSTFVKNIVIKNGVTTIGDGAFAYCTADSITIPDSVVSIGKWSFWECSLESISIPSNVKTIGEGAFRGCKSLARIEIPDGITSLSDDLFKECSGLKKIKIPKSVKSIGWTVFSGCSVLTDIYYGGTSSEWNSIKWEDDEDKEKIKNAAIHYEENQIPVDPVAVLGEEFTVNWDYPQFSGDFTYKITNAATDGTGTVTLISVKNNSEDVVIDSEVTYKGVDYKITKVAEKALYENTAVKTVFIRENVRSIDSSAFYGCSNLTEVSGCKGLQTIGANAFHGCSSLKDIQYYGNADDWYKINISENNEELLKSSIHLPDGSVIASTKSENTLKVTGDKTAKVKYKKLRKKAQVVARAKMMTVSGAQGKLTYKIVSVNKKKTSFKINAANGVVTVKKKLKKGTYTLKVSVTAAGNDSYKPVTKTVTFKIKVK